ncbi:hypothetical protein RIF29_43229 [Crotalaria pallida]|uniref:Uncharacterized protein n=1 Tax=Crotalaria pallida TaxID=3830 RepID=A0AAN9DX10_CROPI
MTKEIKSRKRTKNSKNDLSSFVIIFCWLIVSLTISLLTISLFYLFGVRGTYHESTDFCRFRYCCWVGRWACFYWTGGWSRHCCRASCRRDCATTRGRGKNTRYFIA